MNIREYSSLEELTPIAPRWHELLGQTPRANFFQSLDWLAVYWKHYGAEQRLRVLGISEGANLVGILPLVVRRERTKVGTLRYLTYPLDYWASFYGPIGSNPDAVLVAGLEYFHTAQRDWDVLELRWVGSEPTECERLFRLLVAEGERPVVTTFDSTAVIDLTGTWDGYLASRGSKWRNNYHRWTRRLAELGQVRHVRYRPDPGGAPRWDLYEHCLTLAKASWQGSSQTGTTLTHDSVANFLRDSHQAAANCGALDLNLLTIDDRPVAFAYNYHFRGNVFSMRIGYLPELANFGVGNLLYTHALEDSFRRGDWNYDMGPAHMEAKRQLCTAMLPLYRMSCYRPISIRQQLMRVRRQIQARRQATALAV